MVECEDWALPCAGRGRRSKSVGLPPGQRLIRGLRPMGGIPYEGTHGDWRLRIHGEVDREITLDFQQLLKLPQTEQLADVHCVTAWTVLDAKWLGACPADKKPGDMEMNTETNVAPETH